jgi:hypothetical protein
MFHDTSLHDSRCEHDATCAQVYVTGLLRRCILKNLGMTRLVRISNNRTFAQRDMTGLIRMCISPDLCAAVHDSTNALVLITGFVRWLDNRTGYITGLMLVTLTVLVRWLHDRSCAQL